MSDRNATLPVCVVDDDTDIRETIRFVLEVEGYEVIEAVGGGDALARLRALDGRVGLILLDLMMPDMNGWEFRHQQLEDRALAEIPVVLISGGTGVAQHAEELRMNGHLLKPVQLETLLDTVRRFCGVPPRRG